MENITIKLRLAGLIGILIAILIGVGVFGMINTHNIIDHLKEDAHKEQELAHALELAERTDIEFKTQLLEWQHILMRGYTSSEYNKYKARFKKQAKIVQKDFDKLEAMYKKINIDAAEIKHAAELHLEATAKYEYALRKFDINNTSSGKNLDRQTQSVEIPVNKALTEVAHHLSAEIDKIVQQAEAYSAAMESKTRTTDITVLTLSTILGLFLGYMLMRSIVNPLNEIIRVTQRLAEGDMTVRIRVRGKSEISRLQHALSAMKDKLSSVVKQVRNSANSVSTSADEISKGNLDLSSRTEEQAASIEQTSASMEQVTEKVQQNSDSALQAVKLSNSASEKAEQGLKVAQDTVNAINQIKSSSEKVADIISVIDEIAFQTNLLALNASIEAERAGEQGRGFSVVANEVQKLAQRSADAANEIKALIKNSTEKVLEGTELVVRSSETLEDIAKTSNQTNELMQDISAASQEQATALSQVNTAIVQLEETTQQNAALVEQTSAASSMMNDEAKTLAKLVAFFKFEDDSEVMTHQGGEVNPVAPSRPAEVNAHSAARQANSTHVHKENPTAQGNLAVDADPKDKDWEDF